MSRQIDWQQPLSDADREWAAQYSVHHPLIAINDEQFTKPSGESLGGEDATATEVPPYTDGAYWTKERLVTEAGTRELAIPAKANKADLIALLQADDDAAEAKAAEAAKS
jgi:hypothetical protein